MTLLMITRKVDKDDGLAGFTYNWVKKLAKNVKRLEVICLEKGNIDGLPDNVIVHSLGKEYGKNRIREFMRFHKLAKQIVGRVDGVFAHQNPEYGLMVSVWTKIYKKPLIAWYVHKQVSRRLKILNNLANKMVSVSKESFRLASDKVIFLHHGIDSDMFPFKEKESHHEWRFLSVSRISETKNIHLMIDLVRKLKLRHTRKILFNIVGEPTLEKDKEYLQRLKKKVSDRGLDSNVRFLGSVPNDQTPNLYQEADVFFNFSKTGSVDKTVLEAMSSGTLVFVSNEAFRDILKKINPLMYIEDFTGADKRLEKLMSSATSELPRQLRTYVEENHNLEQLSKKIVSLFES